MAFQPLDAQQRFEVLFELSPGFSVLVCGILENCLDADAPLA
jgi:hypothetical protein